MSITPPQNLCSSPMGNQDGVTPQKEVTTAFNPPSPRGCPPPLAKEPSELRKLIDKLSVTLLDFSKDNTTLFLAQELLSSLEKTKVCPSDVSSIYFSQNYLRKVKNCINRLDPTSNTAKSLEMYN